MRFIIIKPKQREVIAEDFDTLLDAQLSARLGNVDHGVLAPGLGYVVDEFGMFVPATEQSYFGMCGRLIAGNAVLYGFNEFGETVRLLRSAIPDVRFFLGVNDIEAAIAHEEIRRPIVAVNGIMIWEWPQPAPESMKR